MKERAIAAMLLLLMVVACGCTGVPSPQSQRSSPTPQIPALLGNWSGSYMGHTDGSGSSGSTGPAIMMSVSGQKGRIIYGDIIVPDVSGSMLVFNFSGAIGSDGISLIIAERGAGYGFGSLTAPDTIEITYVDDANPANTAIDVFRKI